jgi:hypothetical protein
MALVQQVFVKRMRGSSSGVSESSSVVHLITTGKTVAEAAVPAVIDAARRIAALLAP